MAELIPMLALSPTMEKGMIANWHVAEGDTVASGDILCEIETDKAVMDYEGTVDGVLLKILVPAGAEAEVGRPIAVVGDLGETIDSLLETIGDADAKTPAAGGGQAEAASDDEAAPAASAQAPQPLTPTAVRDGGRLEADSDTAASAFIRSSPLARRLAEINEIDLAEVEGSGPAGRIIKADIEKALAGGTTPAAALETAGAAPGDTVISLGSVRRIVAERLAESKYSAPHYYLNLSVEADALIAARNELNKSSGTKVSFNAFLIKLVAETLKRHRRLNASWRGDAIVEYGSIDIGLAVAQEDGLITPVVRNCGQKGIVEIDRELAGLIDRARQHKLKPEEYTGATFTISNLGAYGIESFTAIINPPGSAILAVGAVRREPVVGDDDSLEIRSLMRLTLSLDHRVVDGAVGALFFKALKDMIEAPIRALY